MKKIFSVTGLFSLLYLLVVSCEGEELRFSETESAVPDFLIGQWIEEEPEGPTFGGTNHIFEFTDSLFRLKFYYWTDAITLDDDCANDYTAYFTGTVETTSDSIFFDGVATNERYEISKPGCANYATYQESFAYNMASETTLILNPDWERFAQILLQKQ